MPLLEKNEAKRGNVCQRQLKCRPRQTQREAWRTYQVPSRPLIVKGADKYPMGPCYFLN